MASAVKEDLLEREVELGLIERSLDSVGAGHGRVVAILGPAGIGKSSLVDAALERGRARDFDALVARAAQTEREFPFAVALQLLEARLRRCAKPQRERLLDGAAGLARELFDQRGLRTAVAEPAAHLFTLVHGLYWLTANLAEQRPLLLAVDDVHASDEPSLRYLLYLAQRIRDLPVALVVAARPDEPHPVPGLLVSSAALVHPRCLSGRAVATLLTEELGFDVPDHIVEACVAVTGGNPFLIHEVIAALVAEAADGRAITAELVRSLTPDAVSQRAFVRLMRLPDAAAAIARAVSILGDAAPLRLTAELAGVDAACAAPAIDALASADILQPPDERARVRFVHPIMRAALYEDQPVAERAAAHARAAALLIAEAAPLEQIAAQLMRAARGAEPRAVEILRAAAREAAARAAPASAALLLERSLDEPLDPRARADLQLELAQAQFAAGALGAAERSARAACAIAGVPADAARANLVLGRALYAAARHGEAARAFEAGLARLDADDERALAHELRAGYAAAATLDESLAREGVALAEVIVDESAGEPTLAERALFAQLAVKHGFGARPREDVRSLADRAWGNGELLAAEGVNGTLWTLVTAALACADYLERDIEVCSAALEAARASGSVLAFATASYCRVRPLIDIGRLDEAIADAEAALAAGEHGWQQHAGAAAAALAHALIERGQLEDAAKALASIDQPEMRSRVDHPVLLAARARLELARGASEAALHDALEAGRLLAGVFGIQSPVFDWRATAALAAARTGDHQRAREVADEELRLSNQIGAPGLIGRGLRVRGLVEGGEAGLELLAQAISTLEASEPRLELARALIDHGAALRRANRRRAAHAPLERGFERAAAAGAFALAERARVELAALGARPRWALLAGSAALTPSERRVAEMAAGGMTNKQIAQDLFVTLKTVEGHLNHTYQKLGIGSRAQLREALTAPQDQG